MDKVVITINGVKYEAVEAENRLGKCEGCVFSEECVNQECHCGFLGNVMDWKHFVISDKQ